MKDFILKYWLQFLFSVIAGGLGAGYKVLSKRLQKQLNDQKALKEGTQALLRNEIIREYDKYMDRGYIPIYGMENVTSMYKAYHTLGGNGTITKLIDELTELSSMPRKEIAK